MQLRAEVYTRKQLSLALDNNNISYVYAPYDIVDKSILNHAERIVLVPPVYLANCEENVYEKFKVLNDLGFKNALVHTIGNIEQFGGLEFTLFGGSRLNCTNSDTLAFLHENNVSDIIVSPEITAYQINALDKPCRIGFIAYGYLPLMVTRRCPISNGKPCNKACCNKFITDRMGNKLHVICNENSVEILNSDTLYLADKLNHFGSADFAVLKFTRETEINEIILDYVSYAQPKIENFTRGRYFKGVQN